MVPNADEVRTQHVPAEEVEYLRWKAERWMKVRHMPAAEEKTPGRQGLAVAGFRVRLGGSVSPSE
jgi:hypothetical protein